MQNIINSFEGKYRFLSNFADVEFEYDGIKYLNSEAAYQAQKTHDRSIREKFSLMNAGKAKREGGKYSNTIKELRSDWESVKYKEMLYILDAKFSQNTGLKEKLIATEDSILVEGNTWHDNIWGSCKCEGCKNKKHNNYLGKTLTLLRQVYTGKMSIEEAENKVNEF